MLVTIHIILYFNTVIPSVYQIFFSRNFTQRTFVTCIISIVVQSLVIFAIYMNYTESIDSNINTHTFMTRGLANIKFISQLYIILAVLSLFVGIATPWILIIRSQSHSKGYIISLFIILVLLVGSLAYPIIKNFK